MRPLLVTLTTTTALILAGCSEKVSEETASEAQSYNVGSPPLAREASAGIGAPDISPHAAPGVAFSYRYAFVLPDKSISAVQEQHAAACEKLGPARCRITGMRYTVIDEDQITGELAFKLAPDLARAFGKEGIVAVEKAEGKLVDAAIEGEDVGTQITASQTRSGEFTAELARLDQRLAGKGLSEAERNELRNRAENIRQQLAAEQDTRRDSEDRLANTPMNFRYSSDAGFRLGTNPFAEGAATAWNSFGAMLGFVLLAVGALLPWLLLVALLVWIWRSRPIRKLRQWVRRPSTEEVTPDTD